MADASASRFEYRVFAGELRALRERLLTEAKPGGSEVREEVYLLGTRLDRNVKIREGSIHIKALREIRGGLERWEPTLRAAFPLAGEWVCGPLAESLGLARLEAPRASYAPEQLLEEVVAGTPELEALRVRKEREHFSGRHVRAEFARIRGPDRLESVAVESEDPEVVRVWVQRLALDRWPNTSYVRCLRGTREGGRG